jgi:ABC-type transport system substrate-binding protein
MSSKTIAGLFWYAPGSSIGDPDGIIYRVLGPGGIMQYWDDAEFFRLGEEARFSLDPVLRKRNYDRIQDLLRDNQPWVVLFQQYGLFGTSKTVNWKSTANLRVDFRKDALSFAS